MNDLLNQNIKDIIGQYPAIAEVLDQFHIGCTTCSVGTCSLKDIVEIHHLSEAEEQTLFLRIAEISFPGQKVEIPHLPRKYAATRAQKKMSPPIVILMDEHQHILRVLAALPSVIDSLETTLPAKKVLIGEIINFIKNYADRIHHAKEEDILFKLFDPQMEIMKVMLEEHEMGRSHVRAVLVGLVTDDPSAIALNLLEYGKLLKEHIRKEDEILYPWMDRQLTDMQVGRLYSKFMGAESAFSDTPRLLVEFSKTLITTNK